MKVLHCGNRFFCSCDLDLDPMTFIYNINLTRIPWKYTECENMNFLHSGSRKLSCDRQTDRHRRPPLHTTRFAGGQLNIARTAEVIVYTWVQNRPIKVERTDHMMNFVVELSILCRRVICQRVSEVERLYTERTLECHFHVCLSNITLVKLRL